MDSILFVIAHYSFASNLWLYLFKSIDFFFAKQFDILLYSSVAASSILYSSFTTLPLVRCETKRCESIFYACFIKAIIR